MLSSEFDATKKEDITKYMDMYDVSLNCLKKYCDNSTFAYAHANVLLAYTFNTKHWMLYLGSLANGLGSSEDLKFELYIYRLPRACYSPGNCQELRPSTGPMTVSIAMFNDNETDNKYIKKISHGKNRDLATRMKRQKMGVYSKKKIMNISQQ